MNDWEVFKVLTHDVGIRLSERDKQVLGEIFFLFSFTRVPMNLSHPYLTKRGKEEGREGMAVGRMGVRLLCGSHIARNVRTFSSGKNNPKVPPYPDSRHFSCIDLKLNGPL